VQIFLIRHPRPLVEDGVCYGQLDVGIDDPQPIAARLRSLLPGKVPVISSPLQRARRLAEVLHPQPQLDARLMEISFGDWEGRRWDDIDCTLLDAWAADVLHFTPPSGESAAMLQARAVECAAALTGAAMALVTHSGVMRALLGHWLKLPVGEWSQLKFEFGHATLIELENSPDGSKATLHYMNR
jgi:alpha-ribazole phosphatase